jgi:preprotein translocase subunit SecA
VTRAIRSAQTQVETQNFEIRKNVLKYDEVMNEQRKVIYAERRRVLEGEDIRDQVQHMITDVTTAYVVGATSSGYAEDWDLAKLWTALKTLYPVKLRWESLSDAENGEDLTSDKLLEAVLEDARQRYADRETEIEGMVGDGAMRELERRVVLSVLDRKWREHLYEMDYLKEGIGLRAMAQRDPLVEYQREGFDMFNAMLDALKEESVGFLFNLQVEPAPPADQAAQTGPSDVPGMNRNGAANDRTNGRRRATPTNQPPVAAPQDAIPQDAVPQGRHAAAPPPAPAPVDGNVPPALRGKGLGSQGGQQRLTYSGPAEGGGVQSQGQRDAAESGDAGTRRARREQARAKAKSTRKRPNR